MFISSDNRRKGTKEDCYPQGPLQRGMQPLLLVALSLRYARTIKGPAYFFCCDYAWLVAFLREGAISNTMLKHSGSAQRQGAESPDERGLVEKCND